MGAADTEPWRMCRTCMREADCMFDVYSMQQGLDSDSVADMISACTGLMVDKSDGLPEKVCDLCYEKLRSFVIFRREAVHTDNVLRQTLARRRVQVKVEVNDAVKMEPHDTELPMDFLDNCLELEIDEFSEDDEPLIKLEGTKSKEESQDIPGKDIEKTNKTAVKFGCNMCGKLFQKRDKLRRHESTHTNGKSRRKPSHNECEHCYKTFKKPVLLRRHMIVHDLSRKPFLCTKCPERFPNKAKLLTHLISHPDLKNDPDAVDTAVQNSAEQRQQSQMHRCAQCEEMFQSAHALSAHSRKHRLPGRVLACSICKKVFKKTSHLKRHERSHEDNKPFKCGLCTKSFALEERLTEHQNQHKGVKPHACPVCAKRFAQRCTLAAHLRVHTRERPHLCPACGKRFDSSTNLNQHLRRHDGYKAFACVCCPARFVSKGELKSHMSTHTGAKPFVCDTCGTAFTKTNSLAKHKLRHLGVKPHECDVCRTRFSSKEHLKRHYRIHTGEKPYKCDLCERAFTQSNDLNKHKRVHLGPYLYQCTKCSESFRLKTELRNHASSHYVDWQVAAGAPAPRAPPIPSPAAPVAPAAVVVVTRASEDTVLTARPTLLARGVRGERTIAEHVRRVPTAISVRRVAPARTAPGEPATPDMFVK